MESYPGCRVKLFVLLYEISIIYAAAPLSLWERSALSAGRGSDSVGLGLYAVVGAVLGVKLDIDDRLLNPFFRYPPSRVACRVSTWRTVTHSTNSWTADEFATQH